MNWKKNVNLFLSMMLAFSTMMSDATVNAEGEEETEEPVIEEVTEIEETAEPEVTEIITEEEEGEIPEEPEVAETEQRDTAEATDADENSDNSTAEEFFTVNSETEETPTEELTEEEDTTPATEEVEESAPYATWGDYTYSVSVDKVTISKYQGSDTTITIPSEIDGKTVTSIGNNAFNSCTSLTTITFPHSLTEIGWDAFFNCTSLTEITIPDSIKLIGRRAFANCTSLQTVNMPEKFTSETRIESGAFSGCQSLSSMIIPEGVTELPGLCFYSDINETIGGLFSGCDNLKTITLPSTIQDIGSNALADLSSLENIIMPERFASNTYVGNYAFSGCEKLTSITIPEGVVLLGGDSKENGSFAGCSNLKTITLPSTLTKIDNYAFYDLKNVETINMPERFLSEISLGNYAFQGCEKLTSIVIPEGVTELHEVFVDDYNSIIGGVFYGCNSLSSVSLPSTLTKIGDRVFYGMTSLKTVIMPEKFTSGAVIGSLAFFGCSNLQSISIPEGTVLAGAEFADEIFDYSGSFGNCSSLETVILPGSVAIIPEYTFRDCTSLSAIVIPEGTTKVEYNAFLNCQSLKSVQLPSTLQYLDEQAFVDCIVLENVIMPAEFKPGLVISKGAFENCSSLKSIDFAEGTTEIYQAFIGCDNLNSISLPSTITKISDDAFYEMKNLAEVNMPKHVPNGATIGKRAFYGCESLKAISIPEGITMLPDGELGVFGQCRSLKTAELPKTLNYIGEHAFVGCISLETIIIPEGVSVIGAYSFAYCGLNTVYLPSTISEIQDSAFSYCGKLASVVMPDHFASGAIIHDRVFSYCDSLSTITIPEGVININYAFKDCDNLTEITLPSTLEEIKESVFENYTTLETVNMPNHFANGTVIGKSAFKNCDHLLSLSIPEGITTVPDDILYGCSSLTSISLPSTLQTIGVRAFYNCSSLSSITIPEKVTEIGSSAFYNCSSLASITIPEKVTIIGSSAFSGCSSLASIIIPDGITRIEDSTFENCTSLSDVECPSGLREIGKNAFHGCAALSSIVIPETIKIIGNSAFDSCSALSVIQMPEKLKENDAVIGDSAFSSCTNLQEFTISEGFTSLGKDVFQNCSSLTSVTILDGITAISKDLFSGCTELTTISLPATINTIGDYTFSGFTNLQTVTMPDRLIVQDAKIGNYAFYNCKQLKEILIPEGFTEIGDYSFYSCTGLEEVFLPDGLENIGDYAFYESTVEINSLPSSIIAIGDYAFYKCKHLTGILSCENTERIGNYAFSESTIDKVYLYGGTSLGEKVFENCQKINTVLISSEYNYISTLFNQCENIKKIYYNGSSTDFTGHGGKSVKLYRINNSECGDSGEYYDDLEVIYYYEDDIKKEKLGYYLGTHINQEFSYTYCTYDYDDHFNKIYYTEVGTDDTPLKEYWDVEAYFDVEFDALELEKGKISFTSNTLTLYHISAKKALSVKLIGDAKGKKINFTSSDENVVAFDKSVLVPAGASWGTIVATGAGTATITATTEDGKYSASIEVTVLDTEEHFGFLSEIRYNEKIFVIDGEEHTFRNDDPDHTWQFQPLDNDHFNAHVLYYMIDEQIVDVDILMWAVKVEPIWPQPGIKNVYVDVEHPAIINLILKVSSDIVLESVNCTNENLVISSNNGTIDVESSLMLKDSKIELTDEGNIFISITDVDNLLLPGNKVTVQINKDFFNYVVPDVFLEHGITESKYITTEPLEWSFTLTKVNRLTDSNFFGNSPETTGFTKRQFTYDAKTKKDRLLDMATRKEDKIDINDTMNEIPHKGVCYGTTMTQALYLTNRISMSDLTDRQGIITYSQLETKTDYVFRDNIIYYYMLQYTSKFRAKEVSFASWKKEDAIPNAFFEKVISKLNEGELVPLYYKYSLGTHILLLYGLDYDKNTSQYKIYYLNANDTYDGKLHDNKFITVSFNKRTFSIPTSPAQTTTELMYAIDLDSYYRKLQEEFDDEEDPLSFTPGKRVLFRDRKTMITSKEGIVYSSNSECNGYSDMTLMYSIASSDDSPLEIKDYYLIKNLSDHFTVSSENKHIQLSVSEDDQYIKMDIRNADLVDFNMEDDPKLVIHGDNYSFDVRVMTDEKADEYTNKLLEIRGNASADVTIEKIGNEINAVSDEMITNIETVIWDGDGTHTEQIGDSDRVDLSSGQTITLSEYKFDLAVGDEYTIPVVSVPEGYTESNIVWSTDHSDILEVSANGLIKTLSAGTADVIAEIKELNISKKVKIAVHPSNIHIKDIAAQKYSGSSIKPNVSVYDGLNLLTPGTDYTITYKNNVKAYTLKEGEEGFSAKKAPQIIIKAKGNYSGTKTVYFTIDPLDISSSGIETLTTAYTGKVQKLSPTVVFEGKTLKKGTDYTLVYPSEGYTEPGTYSITVTGKGNYTGSRTYRMIIGSKDQINLSKTTVSFDKKSYVYDNGNQITPVITVKNGKTVIDPSLYTVSYGDNNTVGNGTVTITGNDSETIGTRTVTFKITGTPITKLIKVTVPKSVTRGTELKDAVKIEASLTEGTDYEVTYDETENAGKANIVITGINGYTGTIKKTVTVVKDKLTAANTVVNVPEAVMMKNGAMPAPTVTVNGTELVEGSDYTLSYANNKKAGTGTVTVKGIGNYTGSLKQTFTITAKDLSETTLEYANNVNSSTKKGSYKTTVVIRDEDGGVLKANTDYTLKFYDGDTEIPATATANDYLGRILTVKASGKGNYTGEEVLSAEYTVTDSTLNLAKASISIKPQQYQSGKPVEITSPDQFSKSAMGKTPLTLGEDFEVYSYSNNTAKGTATVVFKGIGEYSGYKSVTYKIGQRTLKDHWEGIVSFFSRLMN